MLFCLVIVRLVFDYVQILCAIIRITSKRCSVNNYKGGLEMVNKTLEKMERLIRAGTLSKEKNIISTAERVLAQEYVRRT
jgi:hypothetical protein